MFTNHSVIRINDLPSSRTFILQERLAFRRRNKYVFYTQIFNTIPGLNLLGESITGVVKTAQPSISKPIVFRFEKKNGFIDQQPSLRHCHSSYKWNDTAFYFRKSDL